MHPDAPGDGFIVGTDGVERWGLYGAAGLLLRHTDDAGTIRYLLAERSALVQHPLTWAYPGGALRRDETPEAGAVREFAEEFGVRPTYAVAEVIVDRPEGGGGWFYATVVADVAEPVTLGRVTTWENTGRVCWATRAEMAVLRLHPGIGDVVGRALTPESGAIQQMLDREVLAARQFALQLQERWRSRLVSPADMRELLPACWKLAGSPGSGLPSVAEDEWRKMFRFAAFPAPAAPLTLYRGTAPARRCGMSWTTDVEVALRFAAASTWRGEDGRVWVATVQPRHVLATLARVGVSAGREVQTALGTFDRALANENEVVVDPLGVKRCVPWVSPGAAL
jgi:ADP-ribose pyrophosphatase YjhB (NUDIX family)